jgi:hypothetical protein
MGHIRAAKGLTTWETPTAWLYDFISEDERRGLAIWECKWHARWYPTFDISSAKVARNLDLAREHGCPLLLGAGIADRLVAWVRLDAGNGSYLRDIGGRVDRGHCELESMLKIPWPAFTVTYDARVP